MKINKGRVIEVNVGSMKIMSVKLEIEFIQKIDNLWKKYGYKSRSDFIRDALAFYLNKLKSKGEK